LRNLQDFQNVKWSCWRFKSSMMLHYDNRYKCITDSDDHSAFNTSANVHQSAQHDILLHYRTSLLTQFTWYSQGSEDNANMIGQAFSVDKKNNAEFWCGNFLKNGHFEKPKKHGRHLRAIGCEDVKCFRTLYMLDRVYC